MAKVLVFKHVAAEPLGLLDPMLRARGHRLRFANFFRDPGERPTLERYDALVVLGGPMNVDQADRFPHLNFEMRALEHFLKNGKPILGICLGAQLLAHTLGAAVKRNPVAEIGWYPLLPTPAATSDPVLGALKQTTAAFQWHGQTFEVPAQGRLLASSPFCANQAFAYDRTAWGFQFHLEVDRRLIARWLSIQSYVDELRESNAGVTPERILGDTDRSLAASETLARAVFSNWLDLLPAKKARVALPSR